MSQKAIAAAAACLAGSWIGSGPKVAEFEIALTRRLGCSRFVATSSGTAALTIAYDLADIGAGDCVVTTPLTCLATNLPLLQRGAEILWADIDMDGTLSPEAVRTFEPRHPKAIVSVDFGGLPSRLDELANIAREWGASLIEDAAHAFGALYNEKPVGAHEHSTCFSFQAVKMLTTIDGGGLTVGSATVADRARRLRWFGLDREVAAGQRRTSTDSGYKAEMTDVAAVIGLENLTDVDSRLAHNGSIAERYANDLGHVSGLVMPQAGAPNGRRSANWLFPILVERRDEFKRALSSRGVECEQLHYPNDSYAVFADVVRRDLQNTRLWEDRMVCIPIGDWMTSEDVEYTVESIRKGW